MSQKNNSIESVVFGGGCFWCTEAIFARLKGVQSVVSGYAGGSTSSPQAAPTYEQVSTGKTGHAEVIQITYNSNLITLNDLLTVFFATHDPTTLNRQGGDVGKQYRSIIFYTTNQQKSAAVAFIQKLNEEGPTVVTEIKPLETFYPAEEYHREYYKTNTDTPYCQVVISPKLKILKERFNQLLKDSKK